MTAPRPPVDPVAWLLIAIVVAPLLLAGAAVAHETLMVPVSVDGRGAFHELPAPSGSSGPRIIEHPGAWAPLVQAYLKRQGLSGGD